MNCLTAYSNVPAIKDQQALRSGMSLALLKNLEGMFTREEYNWLAGSLRAGRLSCLESELITKKLDDARNSGNMATKDFHALYQLHSFLRKAPTAGDDAKCRSAALDKLVSGEAKCLVTNMTLPARVTSRHALFDRVKLIIQDILGSVPNNFLTSPETKVAFGPGSTVNLQNRSFEETGLFFKLTDRLIVPRKASTYLAALVSAHPNWMNSLAIHYRTQKNEDESYLNFERRVLRKHFEIVDDSYASKISFVPKNSGEHRTIGIEMNGLVPLQKIVGDLIRNRLFKATKGRINLNSQKRNQHLAKLAKLFGLATVDLANASSSISYELVRELLPPEWFCLIDAFRSECGFEPRSGLKVDYQMVSSMGNGFTFELESLIFYALVIATGEEVGLGPLELKRSTSVYGDDIIVPQTMVEPLYENLTLFGFTANKEKSFKRGYFFESCGADYYDGTDVRPFFLRREIKTYRDMFFLMNSLLYKVITTEATHLLGLYRYLFGLLGTAQLPVGPLHFSVTKHDKLATDDLEAVLRVPLSYAQANGGIKYDVPLQAWRYKKWVNVGIEIPLSKSPCYIAQSAKYMVFLHSDGDSSGGKSVLRGRYKAVTRTHTTSQWNGRITVKDMRVVNHLFATLSY
uniref:RNA-directed RNA polymerase n=1 Tax=Beihai levi-like virus 29 TaxID=1922415 RepID=A0A1L3KIF4_9VIRU|nr:hypothetical protein [Beihai levi-like virus 29]